MCTQYCIFFHTIFTKLFFGSRLKGLLLSQISPHFSPPFFVAVTQGTSKPLSHPTPYSACNAQSFPPSWWLGRQIPGGFFCCCDFSPHFFQCGTGGCIKRHPDKIWYNQVMWCWCMTTTSRLTSINSLNPLNWGRCEIFWWNLTTYGDLKIHPSLVNSSKTIIQAPVIVSNLSWVFVCLGWLKSSTSWVISQTEIDTLPTSL